MKNTIKSIENKLKLYFFWVTLERFPNLFRPSSKPYISGDSFRNIADHIFDESKTLNPKKVKNNDIVFLSSNLIDIFFKYFHPKINAKYILITHNSDKNITQYEYNYLDENIIHWFAQNLEVEQNNRISLIPIGLENLRRLKFGRRLWFKNRLIKNNDILFSFSINTNYSKRNLAYETLIKFLDFKFFDNTREYFTTLNKSRFVISPEGNGLDTHRIWEGLILNTLPIMINSSFSQNLKKLGVPGIYLKDWSELKKLNSEKLIELYNQEMLKDFDNLTNFNFWKSRIESYKLI